MTRRTPDRAWELPWPGLLYHSPRQHRPSEEVIGQICALLGVLWATATPKRLLLGQRWSLWQPQLWTAPHHSWGGGAGVLDAAIITLMITMMCHLSCGRAVNGLHCTPVPGCAGGWGGDSHIQDNWEVAAIFHQALTCPGKLFIHSASWNPYSTPRKRAL